MRNNSVSFVIIPREGIRRPEVRKIETPDPAPHNNNPQPDFTQLPAKPLLVYLILKGRIP
jgi:hypothetical protein